MTADATTTQVYFAYGSNLHPLRMAARLVAPRLIDSAVLPGWTLRFDKRGRDGSGKCTIAPADDVVHGALYHLTAADQARLDDIEGLGTGYDAQRVALPGHGMATTYVARPDALAQDLPVFDWYLGLVIAGGRHLGFSPAWFERFATLTVVADPDVERAATHARLLANCTAYPPFERISPLSPTQ